MSVPPPDPFADFPPSSPPPDELNAGTNRSGSARERQQRRRKQQVTQAPPARKAPPQTARGNRFQWPRLRLSINQIWLTLIGAVMVVVLVVFGLGRLRPTERTAGDNAVWAGTEWTYDAPEDAAVAAFAEKLKAHEVGTVYAWVSWLQEDGNWRGTTNFPNIKQFVEQFRAAYPGSDALRVDQPSREQRPGWLPAG